MIRLIFALLFAILLTRWLLTLAHGARVYSKRSNEAKSSHQRNTPAPTQSKDGALVPCAHCGTYIPRSEAIVENDGDNTDSDTNTHDNSEMETQQKYFCSDAHRGIFEKTPPKS